MIERTVTYEDLNGEKVTKKFSFHLTKFEAMELEVEDRRGLKAVMEAIQESQDTKEAVKWTKALLVKAVGLRTANNTRLEKNDEIRADFADSDAIGELVIDLFNSKDHGASFLAGFAGKSLQEAAAKDLEEAGIVLEKTPEETPESKDEEKTIEQLQQMKPRDLSKEELLRLMQHKSQD